MGQIQVTDVRLQEGLTLKVTEVRLSGSVGSALQVAEVRMTGGPTSGGSSLKVAEVRMDGTATGTPLLIASATTADAGQVVALTGAGGGAPYTWDVVSITGGVTPPTIVPATDTLSATVQCPPSLAGYSMIVGMTPSGGGQLSVSITVAPSSILTRISGVSTPSWMETRA